MEIIKVPWRELKPSEYNPRKLTEKQEKDLKESIKRFGLVEPIVVNSAPERKNVIIGGHQRFYIAKQSGMETIPVVYVNLPDIKKEKELNVRLNKNTGQWDYELLADFDEEMLLETGFDEFDLENIFLDERLEKAGKDQFGKKSKEDGWTINPDGMNELVGYDLLSVWDADHISSTETGKYFLPLPLNMFAKSRNRMRYSRTHPCELEKIVRSYMREGDYFLESCVGWASFSSVAKFYGYSGVGVDIWDISLKYCKKQLEAMPGKGKVEIKEMDALNLEFKDNTFDIVYCNPPFFNLEGYSKTKDDISVNDGYGEWVDKIKKLTSECYRVLKPNGLAIFTMADFRLKGILVDAHNDWSKISKEIGFELWDHAVQKINSMSITTRRRNYKRRYCVKAIEHILIFKKVIDDEKNN